MSPDYGPSRNREIGLLHKRMRINNLTPSEGQNEAVRLNASRVEVTMWRGDWKFPRHEEWQIRETHETRG